MTEAQHIGADSYSLINYDQLSMDATVGQQIDALRADNRWQQDHHEEIARAIESLIRDIEKETL